MSTKLNDVNIKKEKRKMIGLKRNKSKNIKKDIEGEKENEIDCKCKSPSFGQMIECNICNNWFHFECVKIDEFNIPKKWICEHCKSLKKGKRKLIGLKRNKPKNIKKDIEGKEDKDCFKSKSPYNGKMIKCDKCKECFHYGCVKIEEGKEPKEWICEKCKKNNKNNKDSLIYIFFIK